VNRRPDRLALLIVTATVAIGYGCHPPRSGDACNVEDQRVCTGADRSLACESGRWVEIRCRGPSGCTKQRHGGDDCDDTIAAPGDSCGRALPADFACSSDGAHALACQDGRFDLWRDCRGEKGCSIAADRHLECDTTLGEVGDPCGNTSAYACSVDRHAMLLCDGHSLVSTSSCRGPSGCRFDRQLRKIDCDDSVAAEGDPCEEPNRVACGMDKKIELVCETSAHKYVKKRECRRTECRVEDRELYCD
jgi:hypothetical protein